MSTATKPLVVINIVGLTPSMLGPNTPKLNALAQDGFMAPMTAILPAVTCSAQATMLTGTMPREHGIVGNGWYFRDIAEVWFWRQSNHLVGGEKVWQTARKIIPDFRCSQLFWWYNMYAAVDYSVTPRPVYPADGRKIPALYAQPHELQARLENELGPFPFFHFWGPKADIKSSDWIARAAALEFDWNRPTLQLVYLPHLDYNLQRLGRDDPRIADDIAAIDAVAGKLIDHVRAGGADVLVVSEYGIETVTTPVHINRVLRNAGLLQVRETLGWDNLDCGASRAFAVSDHQVAHVYVQHGSDIPQVKKLLEKTPGIARVLDRNEQAAFGIDHARSGELVAIAESAHWFTYYFWLDDKMAPDYAPTVDIHRKPGYDPAELFVDPKLKFAPAKIAWRVLQKKLGFRMLMDVIPLQAECVKGSHGRLFDDPAEGPLIMGSRRDLSRDLFAMTDVKNLILNHWSN